MLLFCLCDKTSDLTHWLHAAQRERRPSTLLLMWFSLPILLPNRLLAVSAHFFAFHSNDETRFNLHSIKLRYGGAPISRRTPVTHMNTGPSGATNWFVLLYHPFVSSHVCSFFFSFPLLGTCRDLVISTVIESWMIMAWLFGENWSL